MRKVIIVVLLCSAIAAQRQLDPFGKPDVEAAPTDVEQSATGDPADRHVTASHAVSYRAGDRPATGLVPAGQSTGGIHPTKRPAQVRSTSAGQGIKTSPILLAVNTVSADAGADLGERPGASDPSNASTDAAQDPNDASAELDPDADPMDGEQDADDPSGKGASGRRPPAGDRGRFAFKGGRAYFLLLRSPGTKPLCSTGAGRPSR